jgi:hypothetical protein
MAVKKYPWLPPWVAFHEALAMADRIARKRRRRDCVITAWVESEFVGDLRKDGCREPMILLDESLPDDAAVCRVVVAQRLKRGGSYRPWSERQRHPGGG